MKTLPVYQLQSVDADRAGMAAVTALHGLDKFAPAEQMAGLALAFSAGLSKFGVAYSDSFDVARNLWSRAGQGEQALRAVKRYIEGQW